MTDKLDKNPDHITLHFDVPEHSLPYYQFVDCVTGTELILKNLSRQLFNSDGNLDIQILPSEEGGYKINIAMGILYSFAPVLYADAQLGIIKSLFGTSPSDFIISLFTEENNKIDLDNLRLDEKTKNLILMRCTSSILQNGNSKLSEAGIKESTYREALEGKNKFFNSCIKNESVRAVGFDDSYNFSVPRKNFSEHVIELSETEIVQDIQTVDSQEFFSETLNIEIFAASSRKYPSSKWRAVLPGIPDPISFDIQDDNFWNAVASSKVCFSPNLQDKATVQCVFRKSRKKMIDIKVMRVLEYNGVKISPPLTDEQINLNLFSKTNHNTIDNQTSLPFSE